MPDELRRILADLYELDPELKKDEADLIIIVKKIIAARPRAEFDLAFARRLKAELSSLAESGRANSMKKNIFDLRLLSGVLSGYALVLAVSLISIGFLEGGANQAVNKNPHSIGAVKISKLGSSAFGKLNTLGSEADANLKSTAGANGLGERTAAMPARPTAETAIGSANEEMISDDGAAVGSGGASGKMAADRLSMPYIGYNYSYVYEGEDFSGLLSANATVYKKDDFSGQGTEMAGAIASMNISGLELGNFKNTSLNYLSLVEDREFGYEISLSPNEGSFFIGKNWQKWPDMYSSCRDEACYASNRIKEIDLLADDEFKQIAVAFIDEYGIDISGYGEVEMLKNSGQAYEENGVRYLYNDDVPLVFPLLLDGQEVYEEGGTKIGLFINISAKEKRVTNFSAQLANSFSASDYEAVTDAEKIKEIAQNGGLINSYRNSDWDTLEIKLGTPNLVLSRVWRYDGSSGASEELFLPVLMFPVLEKPENAPFYQEAVTVPLVKQIIEEREAQMSEETPAEPILMKGVESVPGPTIDMALPAEPLAE